MPIVGNKPKVLILGSMPGQKSLQEHQYYAHPRNAFWWIMSQILSFSNELNYTQKVSKLESSGIAVWDVLFSCQRSGSLDSNIERASEVVNDIDGFLLANNTISLIAFNGGASKAIFKRHHGLLLGEYQSIQLPSTSPAHASVSKQNKFEVWRDAVSPYLSLKCNE